MRTVATEVGVPIYVVETRRHAADLWDWLQVRPHMLALDTETNALDPTHPDHRVRLTQISDGREAWVIQTEKPGMTEVTATLVRGHPHWAAHFAQSEVKFLGNSIPSALRLGQTEPHVSCTQPMLAYFDPRTVTTRNVKEGIDPRIPRDKGLKPSILRIFGDDELTRTDAELHKQFKLISPTGQRTKKAADKYGFAHIGIDDELYLRYGGLDAIWEARLYYYLEQELRRCGLWEIAAKDVRRQWHIDQMVLRGQMVDGPYAKWLAEQLTAVVQSNAAHLAHYNIPPSAMGASIGNAFHALGVQSTVKTKTGESWNKVALKAIVSGENTAATPQAAELAKAIRLVRQASKFGSSYVSPMLRALELDGKVHCRFLVFGALTGRNTAAEPANQQLPKDDTRIRAAYRAADGWALVSSDLSQGEPRVMAGLSGDLNLKSDILAGNLNVALATLAYGDAFEPDNREPGQPSYGMYNRSKIGFLSRCYGAGTKRLADGMDVPKDVMAQIEANWDGRYRDLAAFADRANRAPSGEVVLESGRRIPLWDRWWVDANGLHLNTTRPSRLALNYFAQGTQRDLLMEAVDRLIDWGWSWALWFLVHDEIILHVPESMAEQARVALQAAMTMDYHGVPIVAKAEIMGRTWMPQPKEFSLAGLENLIEEDDE